MVDAVFHIRIKENADAVWIVPEQIVSTTADNYTAAGTCKLTDQTALYTDQFRFGGDIVECKAVAAISDRENVLHKVH